MDDSNKQRNYFARRAEQEQAQAAHSLDPSARRIHAELAARYTALDETKSERV